jgi:spore maturation protein SpmA
MLGTLGFFALFIGLLMIGKSGIMGLDDRRSLMLRPIVVTERSHS